MYTEKRLPLTIEVVKLVVALGSAGSVLWAQSVQPANPSKEYIRLGDRTLAVANSGTGALVNGSQLIGISAPSSVGAGQPFTATVTFKNIGTKTWKNNAQNPANPHRIGSQTPQDNTTWGLARVELPTSQVLPNDQAVFTINATAPSTPGTYTFAWKMLEEGVEWFGATGTQTITVTDSNNAAVVSISTNLSNNQASPGQAFTATVVMSNNGSRPWTSGANPHQLLSTNNVWSTSAVSLPYSPVNNGQQATFTFTAYAPSTPGTYSFDWRMNQQNFGLFGGTASLMITVTQPQASPPSFSYISPYGGTGSSATFSITTYGNGAPLSFIQLFINEEYTLTNSNGGCYLYYTPSDNRIYFRTYPNDPQGYYWRSAVLGTWENYNTMTNSQCSFSPQNSWSTVNGNDITLNLNISFQPNWTGTRYFHMYAGNTAGLYAGWLNRGYWNVPQQVQVSLSPLNPQVNSNSGLQFYATVTGAWNPAVTWSTNYGSISSGGYYTAPSVSYTSYATVTATSVQDPTKSASTLVTILPAFQQLSVGTISPMYGSAFSSTYQIPITGGSAPATSLYLFVNDYGNLNPYGGCLIYYDRYSNYIYLGGNGYAYSWVNSGYLGAWWTLTGNNRCSVNLAYSSASHYGNDTTLYLNITFNYGWPGYKSFYVYAQNANWQSYGWADKGYWYLPY